MMSLLENKPLTILIAINLIAFMVIFWLIGLIMGRDDVAQQVSQSPAQQYQPLAEPNARTTPRQQSIVQPARTEPVATKENPQLEADSEESIGDSIVREVSAADEQTVQTEEPIFVQRSTTIDVFYDGSIARIEKTDDTGRRTINISNNLKEVERLSESDANYLAELRKMKAGEIGYMSMYKVTQEQARTVTAENPVDEPSAQDAIQNVDYFNKVDVSTSQEPDRPVQLSLAQQIHTLINDDEAETSDSDDMKKKLQAEYIESLQQASSERTNETRTIKVIFGDSLWKIAVRAYGSGFEYPRIYKANPHIKNPDMIRVGEILRVPI